MVLLEDEIRRIEKPGVYAIDCAVPGFSFRLSASGGRSWVLRAMMQGRRREMGLGACSDVTLVRAVRKAAGIRSLLVRGLDPFEVLELGRQAQRQFLLAGRGSAMPPDLPFLVAYFAHRLSPDPALHAAVQEYLVPRLGEHPLSVIRAEDLAAAVQPMAGKPVLPCVQECLAGVYQRAGLPLPSERPLSALA